MRRHELSFEEEERFSRLSGLPELLEGLGVGISGDPVMEALGWNLFAGAFDPPDKPAAPARYAYDAWARVQTLAVPVMTLMRLRLLKHGCSEFSGNRYRYASRRHAAWMLAQAKLLPIEARHCESPAELDAICAPSSSFRSNASASLPATCSTKSWLAGVTSSNGANVQGCRLPMRNCPRAAAMVAARPSRAFRTTVC